MRLLENANSTNPRPDATLPESRYTVVLVEPQYRDNVGHTARAMLNFGVSDLILVNAAPIDNETRTRAVHAQGVLNAARHVASLDDVRQDFEHVVGFAARISLLDKAHSRMSEPLTEVSWRLARTGGKIALVFGREDFGLSNEDVERCDMLATISTSASYRSMNLSHAVTVALYEITRGEQPTVPRPTMATPHEKEVLFRTWDFLNGELGFKPHRVDQAGKMFRRFVGRAGLTSWEYHRIMGVLSRTLKARRAWPPPGVGDGEGKEYEGDNVAPDPEE